MVWEPIIVCCKDEVKIILSEDEMNALKLGPKFCVIGNISEENWEIAIEECIAKIKWDVMGEEMKKRKEDPAMDAIDAVIDQEQREDLEEHAQRLDGEATSVFLVEGGVGRWQFSKKRVTGMKDNSRVVLPRKMKHFKDEAALETMRMELMGVSSIENNSSTTHPTTTSAHIPSCLIDHVGAGGHEY